MSQQFVGIGMCLLVGLSTSGRAQAQETFDAASVESCSSYNPNNLEVFRHGGRWALVDRPHLLLEVNTEADAQMVLRLARQYTAQCFIGRVNSRPNPARYIVRYWQGASANPSQSADPGAGGDSQCMSYRADSLRILNGGSEGWRLMAGDRVLVMLDNRPDAVRALAVARRYSNYCTIGRRSANNQSEQIIEYWK